MPEWAISFQLVIVNLSFGPCRRILWWCCTSALVLRTLCGFMIWISKTLY